jgi:hypothetical protein
VRSFFILERRHRLGIPDRYGKVPAAPRVPGHLREDGAKVQVEACADGWRVLKAPSEHQLEDGSIIFSAGTFGDPLAAAAEKLARLKRASPDKSIEMSRMEPVTQDSQVSVEWIIDGTLWPRFAAKVALNIGRELLGDGWLRSPVAQWLGDVLWQRNARVPEPFAELPPLPTVATPASLEGYVPPVHHVLVAGNTNAGPALDITLFGCDSYLVPLGGYATIEPTAWVVDPLDGKVERLPWDTLRLRMAVDIVQQLAATRSEARSATL